MEAVIRNMHNYCPTHQPIWTQVGPAQLAWKEMKVELEVSAHAPDGK